MEEHFKRYARSSWLKKEAMHGQGDELSAYIRRMKSICGHESGEVVVYMWHGAVSNDSFS